MTSIRLIILLRDSLLSAAKSVKKNGTLLMAYSPSTPNLVSFQPEESKK
jgi:hypothetical protein